MTFELNKFHRNTSDQELVEDLLRAAYELKSDKITTEQYEEIGTYSAGTLKNRFGSWNKAVEKAGLRPIVKIKFSEKELFDNLTEVWSALGRQPLAVEMKSPISKFSVQPYCNKFGGFRKALEAFVEFKNSGSLIPTTVEEIPDTSTKAKPIYSHSTKRNINEKLKTLVLLRDGNKCRICGEIVTGENICFDHIQPWSKGGETVLENLQVLCERHNLLKGNAEINPIQDDGCVAYDGIIITSKLLCRK